MNNLSCPLQNNSPLCELKGSDAFPARVNFDVWEAVTALSSPIPFKEMSQPFVRIKNRLGFYKYVPSLVPYSPIWKRRWRGKLWSAIQTHSLPSHFVTLTYADDKLQVVRRTMEFVDHTNEPIFGTTLDTPRGLELEKAFSKHWDKFLKRFKRYLVRNGVDLQNFHYLRVLEYGETNTKRLHYHVAFWGTPFIPKKVFEQMWEIGFVDIQKPHAVKELEENLPEWKNYTLQEKLDLVRFDERINKLATRLIGYLLKYLTKSPDDLKNKPRKIRIIQPSRGLIPPLEREDDYVDPAEAEKAFFESFDTSQEFFVTCLKWQFDRLTTEDRLPPSDQRSGSTGIVKVLPSFFRLALDDNPSNAWNKTIEYHNSQGLTPQLKSIQRYIRSKSETVPLNKIYLDT